MMWRAEMTYKREELYKALGIPADNRPEIHYILVHPNWLDTPEHRKALWEMLETFERMEKERY